MIGSPVATNKGDVRDRWMVSAKCQQVEVEQAWNEEDRRIMVWKKGGWRDHQKVGFTFEIGGRSVHLIAEMVHTHTC